MTTLRKQCEKLYWDMHHGYYSHGEVTLLFDMIESFALEIERETLEKAAELVEALGYTYSRGVVVNAIRALKTEGGK